MRLKGEGKLGNEIDGVEWVTESIIHVASMQRVNVVYTFIHQSSITTYCTRVKNSDLA